MQVQYQASSEYGEKQIAYYRKTKPYAILLKILKWTCYVLGGVSVAVNMIIFMTAPVKEIGILNLLFFLVGIFLLVDGAGGNLWIDKLYKKRMEKEKKNGEIELSFNENEIQAVFKNYDQKKNFSYSSVKKALQDFEGYYLFVDKEIFYVKRKQFAIGNGYEFPRFLEEKSGIKVEKQ